MVNNVGNQPLAPLPVRLVLTDAAGAVLSAAAWSSELEVDASAGRTEELATGTLAPGSYRLRLECDLPGQAVVLAEAVFAVTDVTPPLLTVVAPLSGAIFNGPFDLSLQVEDGGSGVATVEYQLDGGPWLPMPPKAPVGLYGLTWTPVVAESGDHLLLFRATDKAGNLAGSSPVAITIELCNPFADLVGTLASPPTPLYQGREIVFPYGLGNACSKELGGLIVRLQVSDPHSGALLHAQETTVNLAAQASQTGEFRLAAPGLAAGSYRAGLWVTAAGQGERELAVLDLTVRPDPRITAEVTDRSHLLVWLNSDCAAGESGSDHSGAENRSCQPGGSSSGEEKGACLSDELLEQALNGAVDYYYLARERDEFEAQLRNPLVTDLLIIGGHLPLTGHYAEELREKVNRGAGLIAAGWLPPAGLGLGSAPADTLLGLVGSVGSGPDERWRLATIDSPVTSAGELPAGDSFWKVTAAGDTTVAGWLVSAEEQGEAADPDDPGGQGERDLLARGRVTARSGWVGADQDDNDEDDAGNDDSEKDDASGRLSPAIVLHDYGQGRTIYYAFDYGRALTSESLAPLGALLGDSLRHVHRNQAVGPNLAPLGVAPLQAAVPNQGGEERFRLRAALPPGLRLYDYQHQAWQLGGTWHSDLTLSTGQSGRLSFSILAPEAAGGFALELAETDAQLGSARLSFAVPSDREALSAASRTALGNLRVSKADAARVKSIKAYLEKVRGRVTLCDRDLEQNIQDLEQAIRALLGINSLEVPALRLRLDELLRIEESRWYFHPEDGCGDGDGHDEHRPDAHGVEGDAR